MEKDIINPLIPEVLTLKRTPNSIQTSLIGLTKDQLQQALRKVEKDSKIIKMRSNQLWAWIYQKGVNDFHLMTNISKEFRKKLSDNFILNRLNLTNKEVSSDGTRKYLLKLQDGNEIEAVYIPEKNRGTLCISSQIGCTLNCSFCHTGTQKLVRNLTSEEIVGQLLFVRDDLEDWPKNGKPNEGKRLVSNVVVMGMGEPLYNFESVKDALKIVMDGDGISLSKRRVTLSTSGIVPEIFRAGQEIGCLLAISFHATTDKIRDKLVPINKKWNIETLLNSLRTYPNLSNTNRITFEYVMLKNINDTDEDARRLVKLISGIPSKINLIPFNPWPGAPFERSSKIRIEEFAKIINKAGYSSPIRQPRGEDIMAACGQLKSKSLKFRKSMSDKKPMK
tara:strand:- start:115 stop:1290 length:1176 start_codon:yes stop_codon:yes gene_type:complete